MIASVRLSFQFLYGDHRLATLAVRACGVLPTAMKYLLLLERAFDVELIVIDSYAIVAPFGRMETIEPVHGKVEFWRRRAVRTGLKWCPCFSGGRGLCCNDGKLQAACQMGQTI